MYDLYLKLHILSGAIALLACVVAASAKIFKLSHQLHVWSGRIFFGGMTGLFVTTIIMTAVKVNIFLLLIGIFSYYFAWSGWRLAKNRDGIVTTADKAVPAALAVVSVGMLGLGLWLLIQKTSAGMWIPLLVFGLLGAAQSVKDIRLLKTQGYTGRNRVAAHLQMMLAASIAAITAFLVVNIQIEQQFILWVLPTAIITPLISWLSRKVGEGYLS
jgi:hypothetical protein